MWHHGCTAAKLAAALASYASSRQCQANGNEPKPLAHALGPGRLPPTRPTLTHTMSSTVSTTAESIMIGSTTPHRTTPPSSTPSWHSSCSRRPQPRPQRRGARPPPPRPPRPPPRARAPSCWRAGTRWRPSPPPWRGPTSRGCSPGSSSRRWGAGSRVPVGELYARVCRCARGWAVWAWPLDGLGARRFLALQRSTLLTPLSPRQPRQNPPATPPAQARFNAARRAKARYLDSLYTATALATQEDAGGHAAGGQRVALPAPGPVAAGLAAPGTVRQPHLHDIRVVPKVGKQTSGASRALHGKQR